MSDDNSGWNPQHDLALLKEIYSGRYKDFQGVATNLRVYPHGYTLSGLKVRQRYEALCPKECPFPFPQKLLPTDSENDVKMRYELVQIHLKTMIEDLEEKIKQVESSTAGTGAWTATLTFHH